MSLMARATAGVRWTVIASGITVISELLRNVVLARFLSPVDFGLMAMVLVVIGLAQMYTDIGISAAIIHRQDATPEQLSSLYWLNIFSGWAVFALVWLGTPLVTGFYNEPRLTPLLRVVALAFIITPICSQFEILLQKELLFSWLAKRDVAASVGQTFVAISCAVVGFGVWSLVYGFLAAAILRTLFLLPIGLTRYRPTLRFRRTDLKGYLGFGLFQIGERTAYYLSQRADQLLIGSLLGAQALGYYSFAFNLAAQPLWRINPILTKVAFPVFSKVQGDVAKLKRGYMRLVSMLTAFNAPLLIGLAALAPWAVPTIFGAKWTPSIILVQLLSFVTLLRSINNPIGSLQYAKGRADLGFWWHILALATMLPTVWLACKSGSVTYVAFALLVLQVLLAAPLYLMMLRPLLGKCGPEYAHATLKPGAVALAMGAVVVGLSGRVPILSTKYQFVMQIAAGAIVYSGLLWVFSRDVFVDIKSALLGR